ncbi:hypothetical protein ACOYR1_15200 [Thalassotalea piscium]
MKIFLKETALLSVYDIYEDEKIYIGKTLYGVVTIDEIEPLQPDHRVISTTI